MFSSYSKNFLKVGPLLLLSKIQLHPYLITVSKIKYSNKCQKKYSEYIHFEQLKFENVGFSYEDNCQIIKKIDFTLNKGEKNCSYGYSPFLEKQQFLD